ncbi:hypothetical protein GPK73_02970 [Coprococcus comes]|nr:hypothetical protein [Coprococcus comes]
MKKTWKRLCTGFLALATVVTALPTIPVHAESKQYWTESAERVGIIEKVMNDGSIGSTFNEGYMKVEGETAYCIDINTDFKNGYKTRADASSRMSADQISDVALSLEYVKQYGEAHKELNYKQVYLLEQCVVWQRLSVHLGWQCDNVRASYDEIPKATQDEVFAGARAFVKENKERYECGGYIYSGEGQELGQFWAKLNVGNTKLQKVSSNTSITDGNGNYSIAGATYGVFADKDCTKQLATLTTDENGDTDIAEVKAGTVYIKELSAPAGYKVDKTVYPLTIKAGETATLNVSDTPKVTDTLIELFKIDMETQKDNPQGNASLAGAEFTWKYYAGFYNKNNLPAEATRTWVTKTIAETDSDGTTHYITKLVDAYKVSGDSFYMQDGKAVLPLGTLTVYYQMEKGLLHIRCEITLGKYQDQLLRLEDKLESGLYCELTDKTLHDGYIEYTLLYDMIANRITIDEVRAENGSLRLMKNLVWEYDALPHALIAGGTGGGKTYFLLTLIEALLHTNAVLYVLDPKNADLADLGTVMGNVYHTKEEMIDCVNAFYEGMVQRSEEMKRHPNYKTGENYAYLGLPPCFLIFDEYVAFFEMLGTKESVSLLSQLKKIVMLGRQAGYFLIVACQRPDAKYFSDGIRDNFNFRVGLGRISELGYGMLFGSDVKKQFFQKRIKGRGYCDVGTSVISEFYTPLVPKGHDFLQEIGRLEEKRTASNES